MATSYCCQARNGFHLPSLFKSCHNKTTPSRATAHSSSKGGSPPVVWRSLGSSKVFLKTRPPPELPQSLCCTVATTTAAFSCPGLMVAAWYHVSTGSTVWAAQLLKRMRILVFPSACLESSAMSVWAMYWCAFWSFVYTGCEYCKCIIAVASILRILSGPSRPSIDVEGECLARGQMKASLQSLLLKWISLSHMSHGGHVLAPNWKLFLLSDDEWNVFHNNVDFWPYLSLVLVYGGFCSVFLLKKSLSYGLTWGTS